MPKQVDHEQRRADIAAAVWRLTVEEGLDAVSMRGVAAAAGVSLGQVQHYFASKDDLLLAAVDLLGERFSRRWAAAQPADPTPRAMLRAYLLQLLPLDEERRVEAYVGAAFLTRAPHSPAIADMLRDGFAWATSMVVGWLEDGGIATGRAAHRTAQTLLAVVDGLAMHTLVGHHSPADAEAALDACLADMLGV
jgi:AcrR family transcriptional regulator